MDKRFPAFTAQHFGRDIERQRADKSWSSSEVPFSFGLQNIRDVYLDPGVYGGRGLTESLVLSVIVLLILVMAGICFTSISLAYLFLQKALQRFPYRIDIPAIDFFLGGALTLMIAVAPTFVLVLRAAAASPVESLRRE